MMAGVKYWDIMYTLHPSTSLQMPNIELHRPGIEPGPPLTECALAMESIHNKGVLSADRQGGVKSYVTIAPPHPQASIHVYLHYSGRGSPATNQPPPLLTQHSYKETSPPL